ncbi:Conserved oligomeric Golgi complex subunit 3, partial [Trichoplax sp. H2]
QNKATDAKSAKTPAKSAKVNMAALSSVRSKQGNKSQMDQLSLWNSKNECIAPLSESQIDSIHQLALLSRHLPMPSDVTQTTMKAEIKDEKDQAKSISSIPASPRSPNMPESFENHGMKQPVETAQQFFSWFADVELQMESEQEQEYRAYSDQLDQYYQLCTSIEEQIDNALYHLEELKDQHVTVSTKANTLHAACEKLLAEQTKLMTVAESINNKLSYFNELEKLSRKLSLPTLSVTSEAFANILARLDECLSFLQLNPSYKESQIYTLRFRQCLLRSLNMIKHYVVSRFKNTTQIILKQTNRVIPPERVFTEYYNNFRTSSAKVKVVTELVEQRANKSKEYFALLQDCRQCYTTQRIAIMTGYIQRWIQTILQEHLRDHCAQVRAGCKFMLHVCHDEYELYFNFYGMGSDEISQLLEYFSNCLYTSLRPVIIKINHLETLAELCSILKTELLEDQIIPKGDELAAFGLIVSNMLEDVQERLVYRAQAYIQNDIDRYNPAPGDLAYPDKLQMIHDMEQKQTPEDKEGLDDSFTDPEMTSIPLGSSTPMNRPMQPLPVVPTADSYAMWYPTVRRTLLCLSKLYRCVDKYIFEGLSQEAISVCIRSLIKASQMIISKKSKTDGYLFIIKHILILREQIAPFEVEFAVKETSLDFSHIKDVAYDLYLKGRKGLTLDSNNTVLKLLLDGIPHVTESYVDSKENVNKNLKEYCQLFINHVTDLFVAPIKAFMDRVKKVREVINETYTGIKRKVTGILMSMSIYLSNKDTEYILFKPIKANVLQTFKKASELISSNYSDEDQQIIGCPSQDQVTMLLATTKVAED